MFEPRRLGQENQRWSMLVRLLTSGVAAAVLAVGLAAALGGGRARAATGDPVVSGNSTDTGNPTLAETATEVQYDGGGAPGVVFLAQADGSYAPSAATFPAALAGWTTTNPNITTGVYGYSARPSGIGVIGFTTADNGLGVVGVGGSGERGAGGSFSAALTGVRGITTASTTSDRGAFGAVVGDATRTQNGVGVSGVGGPHGLGGFFQGVGTGYAALSAVLFKCLT